MQCIENEYGAIARSQSIDDYNDDGDDDGGSNSSNNSDNKNNGNDGVLPLAAEIQDGSPIQSTMSTRIGQMWLCVIVDVIILIDVVLLAISGCCYTVFSNFLANR